MKINRIITYILVCLLTSRIRNLLVLVRADGATDLSSKTGIELSLKAKEATNEFEHKKDGNTVTYTAKDNFGFKSVKTGKNGDTVVWSTTNSIEYATKVVLNGKGKKEKIVTIHMPNNTTKSYKKDKNNPWREYSDNSTGGGSPDTTPDSTNEKTAEVDIKKPIGQGYFSNNSNFILTYKPCSGYSINAVKEDSKEIWKASNKDEHSKKVLADFAKNIVTIHIGSDGKSTKVFNKGSDGTWKEESQDSNKNSTTDGSGGGTTQTTPTSGGTTGTGSTGGGTTPATQ